MIFHLKNPKMENHKIYYETKKLKETLFLAQILAKLTNKIIFT